MAYFQTSGLVKHWESISISFAAEAERSTMTAIVGPSGSGKSTVLRMIAGLIPSDDAGASIILDGTELSRLPPGKRQIGMVFQNGALFPHMNAAANVAYGLRTRGISRKESLARAKAFLKRFGLEGFAGRTSTSLSGGEAQRVSLARSLIVEPRLMLFDEPFSALDAPLRKKLGEDILSMQRETGFTGIMVTHDLSEARLLCSRIIVMKRGQISWQGEAGDFDDSLLQ